MKPCAVAEDRHLESREVNRGNGTPPMVELSLVNSHGRSRGTKWHAIDRNMQELPGASRCQLIELEVCSSKSYKGRNMDPNDDMM